MVTAASLPAGWIIPDWPVGERVGALFTTRHSGVSSPPFDGFNLGDHVGDDPMAVAANRELLADVIGRRPVFLRQVHGCGLARLDADSPDGLVADACVSASPDVACTVMVADCLPVLLADRQGKAVAAAHAGWRGLAGGVVEAAVAALRQSLAAPGQVGSQHLGDVLAWLGPCIGPGAF
jgi:polyphenol oxidase